MQSKSVLAGLAAVGLSTLFLTASAATAPDVSAAIRETLAKRFPDVKVVDVRPAPVPGIYEVFTGDSMVYADATGDHLFLGQLVDTRDRRNLSAESMDARLAVDFGTLPLDRAIKTVKGNGSRKLAVFSDPDCPFCQQLEHELASVTDVTIYTFLFPIESLHPDATNKARAIWCAKDPSATWTKWMTEKQSPVAASGCKADPIDELQKLGDKLRVSSTPTMFFANGKRVGGAMAAANLNQLLDQSTLVTKK